jgi:hypothetical protein
MAHLSRKELTERQRHGISSMAPSPVAGTAAGGVHAERGDALRRKHVVIQTLIQRIEKMSTMTFLRNGDAHTAAEAAQHMQAKYAHFKDKIVTAEDFIELCASRSEMTGKPYMVKLGDATPVEANAFLKKELRAVRGLPPP